jgi:hypothetical protein
MRASLAELGARPSDPDAEKYWNVRSFMYTALWLAHLQVVVEGWQRLELHDPKVNALLGSPFKRKLRSLRNALFHFDEQYMQPDVAAFVEEADALAWASSLHGAFSDWFLAQEAAAKKH